MSEPRFDDPRSEELLKQYLAGQSNAASAIVDRYVERLVALARTRISPQLRRRIDPEDVVQSAYRSFFVHAQNQDYRLTHSGDLWRLLASTTLHKLHGQIERETAAKRSIHREVADDVALANFAGREPTVAEVVAAGELLRIALDGLGTDERFVLISTLQGQTFGEIGRSLKKSERTVRRLFSQAKQRFEKHLLSRQVAAKPRIAASESPADEPAAPLRFSDFTLERMLGSGGMGKVFRARHKQSGKTVAIKALHKARQCERRAVRQLIREFQVLAKLQHPNIVGVEGLGRFPGGGFFIVMEFVDGTDLQSRLASGPLSLPEALSITRDVACAVQYAHDHGIIHCDLKPANILVDVHHRVVVTDFGFAFLLADRSSTNASAIGGTAGFIPPEVLTLECPPTRATDIFALGALLWTLVTGTVPIEIERLPIEHDLAGSIEPVCRRCLAKDPLDRFANASDLLSALNDLRSNLQD